MQKRKEGRGHGDISGEEEKDVEEETQDVSSNYS